MQAFSAQCFTPSDQHWGKKAKKIKVRTHITYQGIIKLCIVPAKVMVTVIQSARVFHRVVAMKQHMRGYMVSVHELSVMALLVSQARPFPVEWKGSGLRDYGPLWYRNILCSMGLL